MMHIKRHLITCTLPLGLGRLLSLNRGLGIGHVFCGEKRLGSPAALKPNMMSRRHHVENLLAEVQMETQDPSNARNNVGRWELPLLNAIEEIDGEMWAVTQALKEMKKRDEKLNKACGACREAFRAARSEVEAPRALDQACRARAPTGVAATTPGSASSTPSSKWSFRSVENEDLADKLARREQQLEEYRIYRQASGCMSSLDPLRKLMLPRRETFQTKFFAQC